METKDKYISGETSTGFAFSVLRKALKNWELAEIWPDDMSSLTVKQTDKIMNLILGTDQYKKLIEHCRDKDNIVDSDMVISEITEIMESIGEDSEGKN